MQKMAFITLLMAASCSKGAESDKATKNIQESAQKTVGTVPSEADKAQAQTLFSQRCVPCHGAAGKGDGPASASLNPKPRAFGDPEWQKSVTDDHLIKIIKFGGAAVGKSAAMPNNPDLTDPVVAALKDVVRGFGSK